MAKRYARLLCIFCNGTVSAVEGVTLDYFNMLSRNYTGRPEGNRNIHHNGSLADAVMAFITA
jgi:hypothetical protein